MSTEPSLVVGLCGPELDTMNPRYSSHFASLYRKWMTEKVGTEHSKPWGCLQDCLPSPTPTDPSLLFPFYHCANCLKNRIDDTRESTHQQNTLQGGGCALCLEVVAPWAYQQQTDRLPTADELRTFMYGAYDAITGDSVPTSSYAKASRAFQALPACERAAWTHTLCGVRKRPEETSYAFPLETYDFPKTDGSVRGLTPMELVGCIIGVLVFLALAAWAVAEWQHWKDKQKEDHMIKEVNEYRKRDGERGLMVLSYEEEYAIIQKYPGDNQKHERHQAALDQITRNFANQQNST
jgi:hypothetical protein